MEDLGYETHNSLLNLGSLWIFLTIYFIRVFIFGFAWLLRRKFKSKKLKKFVKRWKKELFFSDFLAIVLEAYFEFLISGYLNWKYSLHQESGENLGTIYSYISLVLCLFVVPVMLVHQLVQKKKKYKSKTFMTKWGYFYDGISIKSKVSASYF